jgi:nicotinate-nucleotide--dimethylbenzimidazole phosphoribosyltransferase
VIDDSVLREVAAAVEPVDEAARGAARGALAAGPGLGRLAALAVELAGMRRRAAPPVERKVLVAVASDLGPHDEAASALRKAASGTVPVAVLARHAGAKLVLVDAGARGVTEADLGPGVLALRVGNGHEPPMREEQAIIGVQTGIALALSLASDGLDVLALADLGETSRHAAAAIHAEGGPVWPRLLEHGSLTHLLLAGLTLAAAAMRVPVVIDGESGRLAGAVAGHFAPPATSYLVPATVAAPLHISRGDGSGAAAALPLLDAAVRLVRELR